MGGFDDGLGQGHDPAGPEKEEAARSQGEREPERARVISFCLARPFPSGMRTGTILSISCTI